MSYDGRAKLTRENVLRIRAMKGQGWTLAQLAARFGVARSTVGDITSGRRWAHIREAA